MANKYFTIETITESFYEKLKQESVFYDPIMDRVIVEQIYRFFIIYGNLPEDYGLVYLGEL